VRWCASGFFGCKHFSKTNELLIKAGHEAIRWALADVEPGYNVGSLSAEEAALGVDDVDSADDDEVGDSGTQVEVPPGASEARNLFEGLVFVVCGLIAEMRDLHAKIRQQGGEVAHIVSAQITHMVTTQAEVDAASYKVARAMAYDRVHVVSADFIHDSIRAGERLAEAAYTLAQASPQSTGTVAEGYTSSLARSELSHRTKELPAFGVAEQEQNGPGPVAAAQVLDWPSANPSRPIIRAKRKAVVVSRLSTPAFQFAAPPSQLSLSAPAQQASTGVQLAAFGAASASPLVTPAPVPVDSTDDVLPKPAKKDNWRPHWGLVKIYKADDPHAPHFPKDYDIVRRDILNVHVILVILFRVVGLTVSSWCRVQVTELNENRNKFYSMELHEGKERGKSYFRIYTHYGRTDLLDAESQSGLDSTGGVAEESSDLFVERKECRYLHSLQQANVRCHTIGSPLCQ
jgi:hypothetical protein